MDVGSQQRSSSGCELVADIASSFGEVHLRVTGASMMPAVWPGDVIQVRRSESASLRAGQIVLARCQGRLVAHRIVRVDGDLLITRGDTLAEEDPPVREADVLGRIVCLLRNGRVIYPEPSFALGMCSAILRRSDFCLRMLLRAGRLLRRFERRELSWSSQPFLQINK
jgi:signal peptidase I